MKHTNRPTSADVIYSNMTAAARLAKKSRDILASQLKAIEAELANPATTTARRMECLRAVLEVTAMLDRTVESGGRLLHKPVATAPADTSAGTITAESVMQEIISGTKHKRSGV